MFILSIGTSLFEVLPLWTASPKIVRFFHSLVDSCIGTICHHNDFTGWVLLWENFISPRNNLFHTQKRFFLTRYRSPNGPHLLRMVQPIRSPEILEPPWSVLDTYYNMIAVFSPASIDSSPASTDLSPASTDSSLLAFLLLEPSPLQSKTYLAKKCIF